MYSNLKKAINSIDEDVNQFTLRYEKVKEVIASKITEYIKNLINPIAEENKRLKEDLTTVNIQLKEENDKLKENLSPLLIAKLRNWNPLYLTQPLNVKIQLKKQSSGSKKLV